MMKFVIDTNIFVSSLSSRSKHHWVIIALLEEAYTVVVSHQILLEYEEVLKQKYGHHNAENFLNALKELPNVEFIEVYFQWKLLADQDDDKFVDTFLSGGADYLVTEDSDFKRLKQVEFPKVNIVSLAEFSEIIQNK